MQGPTYTFKLRDDSCGVVDDVGITLTDNACAYRFVARSRGRPHLICENGEVTIRDFRPDA
jgi:hypothetical protein